MSSTPEDNAKPTGEPAEAAPAEAVDAAVPNAAVPDAAVPDAAVPDAAVPDAAVPDAAADLMEPPTSGIDPEDDTSRIEVIQADSTTPYHSAKTFEELGLNDDLMKGIYAMKFAKPSKIQATSLPMILAADGEYKNLIAQAHNGSGKTACFVLAMLSRIDYSRETTQALCIVPTRELARQIEAVILSMGKFTPVKVRLAVKATESERRSSRAEALSSVAQHIVVGTPGKIIELMKKRVFVPANIKIFVLDEADEMVDSQSMGDQTIRIKRNLPNAVQVLLFSATYKDQVRTLAEAVAPDANHITVQRETLSLDRVQQYFINTQSKDQRYGILNDIYELLSIGQSIIFVRTRSTAADLTNKLRKDGHTVSVLYGGDMAPEERDKVIDEYRHGVTRVLVTTNVLSRGVDISAVSIVINYDLPTDQYNVTADPETYLHRIGRTGRFGRKGVAVNLVYDEHSIKLLKELETYYSKKIEEVEDIEALSERIKEL